MREKETIAEKLARYVHGINFESLPEEVIWQVKRRLIDAFGCALGAWSAKPVKGLRNLRIGEYGTDFVGRAVNKILGKPRAECLWFVTPWGTKVLVPIEFAVEVNTFAVRFLDWNDTYFGTSPGLEPAHPSDNIAAIVAVCEQEGLAGKDLILGIVLAYEIQCRLCDTVGLRAQKWDHVNHRKGLPLPKPVSRQLELLI